MKFTFGCYMGITFVDTVGVLGAIVSIATFLHQFFPSLKKFANGLRSSAIQAGAASANQSQGDLISGRRDLWIGVSFAVLALLLWSISHVTFRTPQVIDLNPVFLSGMVLLLGGAFTGSIALVISFGRSGKSEFRAALRPMMGWRGVLIIVSNAFEAIFYVMAMQLIQAAQVMALWKSNALWILGLLLIFSDEKVRRVSIASTFCVIAGVVYIIKPTISGLSGGELTILRQDISSPLLGSLIAITGGLFFAIYSVSIHFYPIKSDSQNFAERIALQTVILCVSGASIFGVYVLHSGFPSIESESWRVILFNALRLGIVYIFYAEAIKRTGRPLLVACVLAIEIPLTMYIEHMWIGGQLDSAVLYGGMIIVIGALSILREHQYMPRTSHSKSASG